MNSNILRTATCNPESLPGLGNRFLIGNGYLGVRGTLEEYGREQMAAVNLAGIYDRFGDGWREPLNAPNPFWLRLYANGALTALPDMAAAEHTQQLDIQTGIHSRTTVFQNGITLRTERFAHMQRPHLLCMKAWIQADAAADIRLVYGVDGDVWELHGPHYAAMALGTQDDILTVFAQTNEGGSVAVCANPALAFPHSRSDETQEKQRTAAFSFTLSPGETAALTVIACVYTSKDTPDPLRASIGSVRGLDYSTLRAESIACWRELWKIAHVTIEGDGEAEFALNYSLYQLLSAAPRHANNLSVPARGLSGQTYKGSVFWDTELFMLDFYLAALPEVAKSILRYRIDALAGAKEKAAAYGYRGAFYAWESQEGGLDACSDYNVTDVFTGRKVRTYFRDKQIHITAAIIYGLWKYARWTEDTALWLDGGAEVLIEAARFYHSCLIKRVNSDSFELRDVIGADEYHERVGNNAFTNEMARFVFKQTGELCRWMHTHHPDAYNALERKLGFVKELSLFTEAAQKLIRQEPNANGVIEQFDGYFRLEDISLEAVRDRLKDPREYWGGSCGVASDTQIIKQADVLAMLYLLPDAYPAACVAPNYHYYLPRTEHGSSLSACMYALNACKLGLENDAYPLFLKSARADLADGGKQWAGLVYIGGTHPASAGGAYMTMLWGFLGMTLDGNRMRFAPRLPNGWKTVILRFSRSGKHYEVTATPTGAVCKEISDCD